jgi:hypothetical protein
MNTELPTEGQIVQVKIGNGALQPATFRRGQFVDLYGLPLDKSRISEWQAGATPVRVVSGDAGTQQHPR